MSLIIGVTGGIGSGKTTVANCFQEHFSTPIVDTDIIARQVVAPNSDGLKAIIAHFGSDILDGEGQLDRRQLRNIVFSDPTQKQWLNQLLHPMIRQETIRQLNASTAPYTLCVIPLLVENKLHSLVDRVLVVDVSVETQIERTCRRDETSKQQVEAILSSQVTREQRLEHADDVVNNESDAELLLAQVTKLHHYYLSLAGSC